MNWETRAQWLGFFGFSACVSSVVCLLRGDASSSSVSLAFAGAFLAAMWWDLGRG